MKKLPVAAQIYSVRDEAGRDFLTTLKELKKIGYDGAELAGLYGNSAEKAAEMIKEAGLIPVSAHVPVAEWESDVEKTADDYKTIGCEYVAIPYVDEEGGQRPGGAKFPEFLDLVRKTAKAVNKRGMTLLYHNHDFEFVTLPNGKYGLDEIYSAIPADLLQTEVDTCWVSVAGVNPAEYIRKYAGRSPVVHLKDYSGQKSAKKADSSEKFRFRAIGDGCQDWKAILQAALDAGSKWVVVEQDSHSDFTPMEDMRRSREYLRSLGW